MPDHWHGLLKTDAQADLRRLMHLLKLRSSFAFTQRTGQRLWQKSFFDRTLREDDDPLKVVAYIVNNPLRAGLVASPDEYPHWGSQIYTREEICDGIAGLGGFDWRPPV
jgi:REP-associated tyrosine transposase